VRRLTAERDDLRTALFNDPSSQPTLCQFMPELFYFEEVDTGLVCTSASGLPLMRYDLKDRGGVFTLADVVAASKKAGIIWDHHVEQLGLRDYVWNLPFVYVYERRDLTVSIYSVNIYPESIRRALEKKEFEDMITTKFTLKVGYDKQQNQRLELHVERKTGVEDSVTLKERLQKIVVDQLNEENSEWRDFYADVGIRHKILPEITTWPYQDPEHFKPGAKQKWVKK
jgi:phenylacetate-coenzyme A ligase PaaK-like adenylate-forming protein